MHIVIGGDQRVFRMVSEMEFEKETDDKVYKSMKTQHTRDMVI